MSEYLKSHIEYEFSCPACNSKYIGKTDQNFSTCVQEHSGSEKKSPVYNRLLKCEHFNCTSGMLRLLFRTTPKLLTTVKIGLSFLESFHIKWKKPKLNCGIKATKELVLFS